MKLIKANGTHKISRHCLTLLMPKGFDLVLQFDPNCVEMFHEAILSFKFEVLYLFLDIAFHFLLIFCIKIGFIENF